MSDPLLPPDLPAPAASESPTLMVVLGIVFILVWLTLSTIWMAMCLMGTVMANDSGAASTESHTSLILGVLISQVIAGVAGIPAGLAFFWGRRRRVLLLIFGVLVIIGIVGQVGAFMSFIPG